MVVWLVLFNLQGTIIAKSVSIKVFLHGRFYEKANYSNCIARLDTIMI